jgi:anti-sigma regulatory factor (Ser/Thr protein kinase)
LEFEFSPDPSALSSLRHDLGRRLAGLRVGEQVAENVLLVVDEIVNNAIEHAAGYRHRNAKLALRLHAAGTRVVLEFEDPDVPSEVVRDLVRRLRALRRGPPPPFDAERGRGLFLIARRVSGLQLRALPAGGMRLRGCLA